MQPREQFIHALERTRPIRAGQAGVDIAEVKRRYGDRLCLIGSVNCGYLDSGTDEQVVASARYELMLDVWRREGWHEPRSPAGII